LVLMAPMVAGVTTSAGLGFMLLNSQGRQL